MFDWVIRLLAIAVILVLFHNQRSIKCRRYKLLPRRGPRILVLSDFHNNPFLPFHQFEKILIEENPDAFFLLGDLVDRKGGKKSTKKLLGLLKQTGKPIFYVHGNHEGEAPEGPWLREELSSLGTCLEGESVEFNGLRLSGLPYGTTSQVPSDVYLCHNPMDGVNSSLSGLYLAGHTHGGQVRFPFVGAFYVPGQKFFPDYVKGYYDLGEKGLLITSGLGNTLAPIRFSNPIEVLILE